MGVFILILESLRFAWGSQRANMLRTLLSSFGVIIGIFCIIGIFTLVDSLKIEFKKTLDTFISPRLIFVEKWPWQFGGGTYSWWKYYKRPQVSYVEYETLRNNVEHAKNIAIIAGSVSVVAKHKTNTCSGSLSGVSYRYNDMKSLNIEQGRYFSYFETESGADVVVIGYSIAERSGHFARACRKNH